MFGLIALTVALFMGLPIMMGYFMRDEIIANWSKYRMDPLYMFAAFMFKPDDDPRTRIKFSVDTFNDNMLTILESIFAIFMKPVMGIFQMFMNTLTQTTTSLFNIKGFFANILHKWEQMVDVFVRRFHAVFHNLRMTFVKLFHSIQKAFGVATSSLFAGLSVIQGTLSMFDFLIKVVIIMLVIIVVLIIFLFFILWPLMPIIISVIALIAATALGGAVGGMSETFCFATDTKVVHSEKGPIPIQEVAVGDKLAGGAKVLGTMAFRSQKYELYNLWGIQVSGTHLVYSNGVPCFVKDHAEATLAPQTTEVYCLVTSTHKIPVLDAKNTAREFADWEEIDDTEDLVAWYNNVFKILNKDSIVKVPATRPTKDMLNSEAVVTGDTLIETPKGPVAADTIRPGDIIFSDLHKPTKVNGIVTVAKTEVQSVYRLPNGGMLSVGCWIKTKGGWMHPSMTSEPNASDSAYYGFFTDSGTFVVKYSDTSEVHVRDFTDVGDKDLPSTYATTIEAIKFRM